VSVWLKYKGTSGQGVMQGGRMEFVPEDRSFPVVFDMIAPWLNEWIGR
jgi:hypothetical protein